MRFATIFMLLSVLLCCQDSTDASIVISDAGIETSNLVNIKSSKTIKDGHRPGYQLHHNVIKANPIVDNRTVQEIGNAACTGTDGKWHCNVPNGKIIYGAINPPAYPPVSWTVPNWYFDPANSTGCASDYNTCTSATCSSGPPGPGAFIGPCKTLNEVINNRWGCGSSGDPCPVLSQTTTFNVISSEILNSERIVLHPIVINSSNFGVIGTPKLVAGPFTLGTVTSKNRTSHQLLQSTGFSNVAIATGQLVINNTHSSHALIWGLSAGTATLTQPLTPLTFSNCVSFIHGAFPTSEVDTWTTGDTVNVFSFPLVNFTYYHVEGGDSNLTFTGGANWMQYIYVPDNSGTDANSTYVFGSISNPTWIVDSLFGMYLTTVPGGQGGIQQTIFINDYLNGGIGLQDGQVTGGAVNGFGCSIQEFGAVDGDVICNNTLTSEGSLTSFNGQSFYSAVYIANNVTSSCGNLASVKLDDVQSITPTAFLWGISGASYSVADQCSFVNVSGTTWANSVLLNGGLLLDSNTTGTKYSAGVWTDGINITQANLDTNDGLQNPKTGSRYSGAN